MKMLTGAITPALMLGLHTLCVVGALFSVQPVEKKFNPDDLVEVFIEQNKCNVVLGRLKDKTTIQVFGLESVPKTSVALMPGVPAELSIDGNTAFRDAKLLPDKTKIAFSIMGGHNEWSGLYEIKNKKIKQLDVAYDSWSGNLYPSPNGKYIVENAISGAGSLIIVYNVESQEPKWIFTLDLYEFGERIRWKEGGNFHFRVYGWSKDGEKILFQVQEEKYVKDNKENEHIISKGKNLGLWIINVNGKNLKRIGK
ncbi:MAG: hypothetical protein V1833_03225 [Elusimicrobiota bacterium]